MASACYSYESCGYLFLFLPAATAVRYFSCFSSAIQVVVKMHPLSFVKAMMVLHSACIALLTFSASLKHTFSLRCVDVPIAEAQP